MLRIVATCRYLQVCPTKISVYVNRAARAISRSNPAEVFHVSAGSPSFAQGLRDTGSPCIWASHGFLCSIYINPLIRHDMAKIKKTWLPCAAIRTCGAWAWLWLGRLESFWNMPAFNRWAACLRSAGISRMWHGVANVFGGHRCGTTTSLRATGFANTLTNIDKEWQGSSDITEFVDLRWGVTRCIPPVKYSPGEVLHDDHILVSSIYIYLLCEWAPVYTHWPYNVVVI